MKIASQALMVSLLALTGSMVSSAAQNTGLMIQVNPEAHLDVTSVPFTFTVTNPGEVAVSQPVTVTAWVRNLPGQQIQLIAEAVTLAGANGNQAVSAIGWTGSMARATGGAAVAHCAGGDFANGSSQSLISGWNQSGIAACTLTFTLKTDASWAPGTYTGQVSLKLLVQ
jgi:hypothetical protein